MKYFIVTDIHGFYNEMIDSLKECGFDSKNPNHTFVSLGDLLDRGDQPLECLNFVNSLERKILIRGNHEDLMEEALARGEFLMHDIHNGTFATAVLLSNSTQLFDIIDKMEHNKPYNDYIASTVDYAEVGRVVFVHGWIPANQKFSGGYTYLPNWRDASHTAWKAARWYNGMDLWSQGVYDPDRTILCGHWHCSYGHAKFEKDRVEFAHNDNEIEDFSPFCGTGIIALDTCTAYTHDVNCVVYDTDDNSVIVPTMTWR